MTTVILGAGLAGIGAALSLRKRKQSFVMLEASAKPGGLAQTETKNGFSFDQTGHFLHFRNDRLFDYFRRATVDLEKIERRAAVLTDNCLMPYPFQYNLWALDDGIRRKALADLIDAQTQGKNSHKSLADVLFGTWGQTITEVFMRPYNEKLWGQPLEDLPPDCVGRYYPTVNLALAKTGSEGTTAYAGYNGFLYYPASGRIGDMTDALALPVADYTRCDRRVTKIDLDERICATSSGEFFHYRHLISTIPLPSLLQLVGIGSPNHSMFASTQIAAVKIGLRGAMRCPYHWVYVGDSSVPFYRVGFPSNVNSLSCPPGCVSLLVEYTLPPAGPRVSTEVLASTTLEYLSRNRLIQVEDCLQIDETVLSPAYVVNRSPGRTEFSQILAELELREIFCAGRFGRWDYFSMEESFESGEEIAMRIA